MKLIKPRIRLSEENYYNDGDIWECEAREDLQRHCWIGGHGATPAKAYQNFVERRSWELKSRVDQRKIIAGRNAKAQEMGYMSYMDMLKDVVKRSGVDGKMKGWAARSEREIELTISMPVYPVEQVN